MTNWVEVKHTPFDPSKKYVVQCSEEYSSMFLVLQYNDKIKDWEPTCECDGISFRDIVRYLELPDPKPNP